MGRRRGQLPPGWVQPHWLEAGIAPEARTATAVGTVDGGVTARVDGRGLVAGLGAGWALDWWVGAEDGWHVPSREPASRVRQTRLGAAPVVETAMRVPGGEVVHRCYGARAGRGAVTVVEVENRSHVPVALALGVRPYDLERVATVRRVALTGDVVLVEGRPAVSLGRSPAFAAAGAGDVDVADEVFAGTRGDPAHLGERRARSGLASLAVVLPLPHTAVVRVALADEVVAPASLPPADATARGWEAHAARGMRVAVPDERLQAALAAAVADLLLHADDRAFDDPLVVGALERWGFGAEVARLADARGYRVTAGDGFVVGAVPVPGSGPVLERLDAALRAASPTWTWPRDGHPARAPATVLALARDVLLDDQGDGQVALWPLVPPAWLGQGVEVHDAPTPRGLLSYAVRWHGARPALLWDAPAGTTITAPGLEPGWSSRAAKGEALLAPVEPAGGLPGVYGDVEVGSTVTEPGDSFG